MQQCHWCVPEVQAKEKAHILASTLNESKTKMPAELIHRNSFLRTEFVTVWLKATDFSADWLGGSPKNQTTISKVLMLVKMNMISNNVRKSVQGLKDIFNSSIVGLSNHCWLQ